MTVFRSILGLTAACAVAAGVLVGTASAQTTLRITWYNDGNEGEVLQDILNRFEQQNPDIKVILDTVAYKAILEGLPVQLAAGQGPDLPIVSYANPTDPPVRRALIAAIERLSGQPRVRRM